MMRKLGDDTLLRGEIVPAGDSALLVRFGTATSPAAHARVLALLRALDRTPPAGVRDLIPAYASLLVCFDPLITCPTAIETDLRSVLGTLRVRATSAQGRLVRIRVEYGGAAGPDLEEVARLVGLSPEEVVRRHAAAEYTVSFLGFLAGFPYLTGLPPELAVPRLSSPRSQVPGGSVGIAGQQTGVYPVRAPGGWRLIGRTSARLFDPTRHPPALLRPGDRVRFEPVRARPDRSAQQAVSQPPHTEDTPLPIAHEHVLDTTTTPSNTPSSAPERQGVPWLSVRVPGPLTTVQDLGRLGYGRYGVSASGAADADALRLGNLLLGNPPGAAALEITLGGAEFEVLAPCRVALTGAACAVFRNERPVPTNEVLALEAADILRIGWARHGVRVYVCVAGGLHVAPSLGSSATDLRAGLGGLNGRAVRAHDVLWRHPSGPSADAVVGRRVPADVARPQTTPRVWTLRILAGPHAIEAAGDLEALQTGTYVVSSHSDRVGVRLLSMGLPGERVPSGGETLSEGVPRGAIQVPPNGEPIILLADHQTTGGYRVPAVVATDDLWRVAQLRPDAAVRFALVTVESAVEAVRARAAWLERLAAHPSPSGAFTAAGHSHDHYDETLLARGFCEWSDEE